MTEIMALFDLISKSMLKMLLVLGGMLLIFLTLPYSRTAPLFAAGVLGSFFGGLLMQMVQDQYNLVLLTISSLSFGLGLVLIPMLNIMTRLNLKLSEDNELIDGLYNWLKEAVVGAVKRLSFGKKVLDKNKNNT